MPYQPFDRAKHVYRNDAFAELIKDAVRFFNGTPVQGLPAPDIFQGQGVYALYYTGSHPLYATYARLNRLAYNHPIYVGKAVPAGWRQARTAHTGTPSDKALQRRLGEHACSITQGADLCLADFSCRFVIFEHRASDMIGSVEAALIQYHRPLWNSIVDGFGNHDPGKGRYEQARSDWDVLHPGRPWAQKCNGQPSDRQAVIAAMAEHLASLD